MSGPNMLPVCRENSARTCPDAYICVNADCWRTCRHGAFDPGCDACLEREAERRDDKELRWAIQYAEQDVEFCLELATRLPDGELWRGSSSNRARLRAIADRIRVLLRTAKRSAP